LKSLVDGKILNELLAKVAESKGYLKDKRVIANILDKMKYFVSSEYKKRIFSPNNLKPTKDELIDYYIEHKDDTELKTKKKMWTYEIFKFYDNTDSIESNDKIKVAIELENIRQKILEGESFKKYAKFYARPNIKDGVLGFIYKTDYAKIGETADKLKVNEVSELIIQKKAISIVNVTEIKEPQLYKFDYVEEIIKNRVIDEKRDKFKDELRRKLFKKYKVELLNNEDVLILSNHRQFGTSSLPSNLGTVENILIENLSAGMNKFSIKSIDQAGNYSIDSNFTELNVY
jgi:hypothetical protein